jgi:hypothetical protein
MTERTTGPETLSSTELREKLQQLYARHAAKDLPERPFRRALTEYSYRLFTAVARDQLKPGETILREHNIIQAHGWWTRPVLQDPDQEIVSLYLTDRRVIRIRSLQTLGRPISCDAADQTTVDSLFFDRIEGLKVHREIRWGEFAMGLGIVAVALFFYDWLEISGPVLLGVGGLGALHGLLWHSRRVEIRARATPAGGPMVVYATRRKSGRMFLKLLRERVRPAPAQ